MVGIFLCKLLYKNINVILIMNIKKRGLVMERQFGYEYELKIGEHALDDEKSKKLKRINNLMYIGVVLGALTTLTIMFHIMGNKDSVDNNPYAVWIYSGSLLYAMFIFVAYSLMVKKFSKIQESTMMRIVSDREKVIKKNESSN